MARPSVQYDRAMEVENLRRVERPVVVLDVDFEHAVFELVLVNIGLAVAREITVRFDDPLIGLDGSCAIGELPIWQGIRTLRPHKEIRVLFDSGQRLNDPAACIEFSADVVWTSEAGEGHAIYHHDLGAYRALPSRIDHYCSVSPSLSTKPIQEIDHVRRSL